MRKLFTILTLLGVVTCPIFAGSITDLGLFNTGNSSNWKVGGVTATTATTIPTGGDPWAPNTSTSSWIATQANVMTISDGASQGSPYSYTFQFAVPSAYDWSTVVITGRWALDDFGTASVGSTVFATRPDGGSHYTSSAFTSQTFTISGLTSATNTLTFAVTNKFLGPNRLNPTGLRVEFDPTFQGGEVTAIPEPGTLALLGGGLLAFGLFRRRR